MIKKAKITFHHVKTNGAKIDFICSKVHEIFHQEKKLLIIAPNFEAAVYLDELLWRVPEESFIPHKIVDTFSSESIAITMQNHQNINQASYVLNLSSVPSPLYTEVEQIYELMDQTDPKKMEASQKRLQFYESHKLSIVVV